MTKRRGDMRPGEMFGVRPANNDWPIVWPDAYVVLDDKFEIGFFGGALTCIGDVASDWPFEVLS